MSDDYALSHAFRDIGEYAKYVSRFCGKCRRQSNGATYQCELFRAMDRAIVTGSGVIPTQVADAIGLPKEEHYQRPEKCKQFWSKRESAKALEEKAP